MPRPVANRSNFFIVFLRQEEPTGFAHSAFHATNNVAQVSYNSCYKYRSVFDMHTSLLSELERKRIRSYNKADGERTSAMRGLFTVQAVHAQDSGGSATHPRVSSPLRCCQGQEGENPVSFEERCNFPSCSTVIVASTIREGLEALRSHWKKEHNWDPATIGQPTESPKCQPKDGS